MSYIIYNRNDGTIVGLNGCEIIDVPDYWGLETIELALENEEPRDMDEGEKKEVPDIPKSIFTKGQVEDVEKEQE